MNKIIQLIALVFLGIFSFSCNDFLDENPDNRAEVDNQTKIRKLLVSAYPNREYVTVSELSSDNVIDFKKTNPNSSRLLEQIAYWQDVTENDNASPKELWESCYKAIASSNLALESIQKLGENKFTAEKAEALITRAFSHFILVNVFCKHYNSETSATDLGIPYIEKTEKRLNPKYERGNVAEVYGKINRDIEAALPLINDQIYDIPTYHFTKRAAYAFAARFNLYYTKWAKAKEYASKVLAQSKLRDWKKMGQIENKITPKTNEYINSSSSLLAFTSSSSVGLIFGPYYHGARFSHTGYLARNETLYTPMPWSKGGINRGDYQNNMWTFTTNNFDKTLYLKLPYLFQITDAVQQIGYIKTVIIPFNIDETLLVKAEAEAMLGESSLALKDLNAWSKNFYKDKETTIFEINHLYDSLPYSTKDKISIKKKLNPKFKIKSKAQENLLQYILHCRRILTLHEGLRWFDIKRYGIEVNRRQYQLNNSIITVETLGVNDARRAVQLPQDVIAAGLKPNPRNQK